MIQWFLNLHPIDQYYIILLFFMFLVAAYASWSHKNWLRWQASKKGKKCDDDEALA